MQFHSDLAHLPLLILGEVILSKLPEVLVDLFKVIVFQVIILTEIQQYPFEMNIVLQFTVRELRESVPIPEISKHLVYIAVIDRIVHCIMMTAVLCSEGIIIDGLSVDRDRLDVINERYISCSEADIYIELVDIG